MSTTGHETEVVQVQGLKASLKKGGNKGLFNECICSTAGGTAAKVANTVPPSFSLVSEATIIVKFTYAISVANATFKVGDNDAKPIYYRGAALGANMIKAGDKVMLRYDGTSFNIIGSLGETYESKQAASGGTDLSLVTTGEKYAWNDKISSSEKGASNGVASLDANGKVPSSQLQSYVDDVIEGYYKKADGKFYEESTYTTEITGESGKIYTDLSTNTTYRWSGTQFTQIKGDLAIGTTTGTAADGGIVNTHVNDSDIHVTLQDKSNWSGKQDALEFNTAYDASTNKVATMADVPDAQIQSDWNQTTSTAKDYIKNKPNLATVATSGSYNDLSNKPTIPTIEDFHEAVATLSATPTSSTLTYTRDGVTYEYKIGDQVRVHDTEKGTAEGNYYVFYTLKDKSNNTAYWEESGSGGGVAQKSYIVVIDTNQSDKSDITNAKVTYDGIQYGNGDTITVPISTDITSSDLSATSITGYYANIQVNGAIINITYLIEIVSVTVTTDFSGASTQGQIITINGSNYTVGSTGIVTAKVPYNTQYSISADTRTGFNTPTTQNFTAGQASRSVTMTYTMVALGVFAYYSDKTFRTEADADSNAIGVAVITSNIKVVVDKINVSNGALATTGTDLSSYGTVCTTDLSVAKMDFAGESNTNVLIAAFGDAVYQSVKNTVQRFDGKGYIPACGEFDTILDNVSAVNTIMTAISGTVIQSGALYWSSTLYDGTSKMWWYVQGTWYDGYRNGYQNNANFRAFMKLQ